MPDLVEVNFFVFIPYQPVGPVLHDFAIDDLLDVLKYATILSY